jgi:uncharacterized protein YjbI with pentapeptide repeats
MRLKQYKQIDSTIDNKIDKIRKLRLEAYDKNKRQMSARKKQYPKEKSNVNIKKSNLDYYSEYASFDFKSYNFVVFEDVKWGKNVALSETDYIEVREKSFYFVDFKNCIFDNIIFNGCHFIGCRFEDCKTLKGKVIFQNCNFRTTEIEYKDNEHIVTNVSTEFTRCHAIQIAIRNCLADYILFDNCTLILSEFKETEMPNSIFNNCGFYSVNFSDSLINKLMIKDISNHELQFHNTKYVLDIDTEIYVSYEGMSKIKKRIKELYKKEKNNEFGNKSSFKEHSNEYFKNMAKMYFTLTNLLSVSNINDEYAREYSYLYNIFSMKIKRSYWEKSIFHLSWLLFGFGERMGRFIFWFIFFIFGFAATYMFTGLNIGAENRIIYTIFGGKPVPIDKIVSDFMQCLHFSIITFSTVGYGNVTPYGLSHLVSAIQIIIGIVLVALFTSVIVKKFIR